MKLFLIIVGWVLAALVAIFIWHAFPDVQPAVTWGLGAAFIYHMVSTIVEETVKRVVRDELLELRRQSHTNTDRLEAVDRKVSAILADALDERRRRDARGI